MHVKGKCDRSQRKSDRPQTFLVKLSTAGNINNARCSCTAGLNGYCNHTMGMLCLIDHVTKLKVFTFPVVSYKAPNKFLKDMYKCMPL